VLAHDWLTGMRGGERVLELLCEGFPAAHIYTLIRNPQAVSVAINRHEVHTSWLQRVPGIFKRYRYFLPFYPRAIEAFKPPEADLLISTSHCVAKGLKPRSGTKHLCYCFTPMRYAWSFHDEYFGSNPIKRALLDPVLGSLRNWDRKASDRVDLFVAISQHVRRRIEINYGREAEVVYPPVNTEFYTPGPASQGFAEPGEAKHEEFDLIVSALVPYKRVDLAVDAYKQSGRPLKIVGTGTEHAALERYATKNIEFLGWRTDEEVRDLYRQCRLLVFPGEEDFGIVPVEAQACGKPVVAYGRGGSLETIDPRVGGVFFKEQSPEALTAAVNECAAATWDPAAIRAHAGRFSTANFLAGLDRCIRLCFGR
jgi:glycosyltransferase involved in cell wall biosynthesis